MEQIQINIPSGDDLGETGSIIGERLDRFLAGALDGISRSRVQGLINSGYVTVNGRLAKPKFLLPAGAQIEVTIPDPVPSTALPQDLPLSILYEDDDLAVIDKPSGMVVHPAAGNPDGTVVNALLHRFGELSQIGGVLRPGIVHRLDKDTSGCMVVARNDVSHQTLSKQFADRTVSKIYLAAVERLPSPGSGRVDTHIARNPANRLRMAVVKPPAGKHALTDYRTLSKKNGAALLECTLHTGRTHQIRVHMKEIGHPLLGDPVYARPSRQTPPTNRLMLHAWKLAFTHPATKERLAFEATIPSDFSPWMDGFDWINEPSP
jgi:23S rRNA pseudouridine1911/1915/1917 synthase